MYLIYFLNADILVLNTDILSDILNIDILPSYWKQGNYKTFMLFSYPNRGNKTNGGCPLFGENCGGGLCRMVSDHRTGGVMIFLGVLDVQ